MVKESPVITVYEKPFEQVVTHSLGPIAATMSGETFATHESLLAAVDHEAAPSKPSAYVRRVAATMGIPAEDVEVSGLAKRVFKDILRGIAEVAHDGTEVINLTKLSIQFGIKTREHPEVAALDEVSQQRVLIGVMSFLAFIRDECTFKSLQRTVR